MLDFWVYDVFTSQPYAGNPLAIVQAADNLSTAQMQTIAREFNLSETIFVQKPDNPIHSAKVRIFFPTAEIPFAGHPTIGCAIFLAEMTHSGDFETLITLEEVAGLVPVQVARRKGKISAEFTAPLLPQAVDSGPVSAKIAAAGLGLLADDICFDRHRINTWQAGPDFAFIPIASRAALAKAWPSGPAWEALKSAAQSKALYLYCRDHDGYSARMFAPDHGMSEDPATGSASAILAAQLLDAGELAEGRTQLSLTQGIDMGRPSQIGLTIEVQKGEITAMRIKGSAICVRKGALSALPLKE